MNAYWKYNLKYSRNLHLPKIKNPVQDLSQLTSGLAEVNDPKSVRIGRSWRANELRLKSDSDLHKLWHVLLKEKLSLKSDQYHVSQNVQIKQMNERLIKNCLSKVQVSMTRLRTVIGERLTIRNEFMSFLEFYYIRKMQNDAEYKIAIEHVAKKETTEIRDKKAPVSAKSSEVEKITTAPSIEKKAEKKVHIRGAITSDNKNITESDTKLNIEITSEEESKAEPKKVAKKPKKPSISVLTEEEKEMAQKLTKKYKEKELIGEYVSNSHLLQGKEKRKIRAMIDASRAGHAKNIFMKELAAVSYKYKSLKQSANPSIRKLENLS